MIIGISWNFILLLIPKGDVWNYLIKALDYNDEFLEVEKLGINFSNQYLRVSVNF